MSANSALLLYLGKRSEAQRKPSCLYNVYFTFTLLMGGSGRVKNLREVKLSFVWLANALLCLD